MDHAYYHEPIDNSSEEETESVAQQLIQEEEDLRREVIGQSAEYVTSQRGGEQLKIGKYLHRIQSKTSRKKIFKCIRPDCKCRIHVKLGEEVIVEMNNWHQHSDDRLDVGRRVFRHVLKEKTGANVEKPLHRVHTEAVAEVYGTLDLTESEKSNVIRSHLNRVHRVKTKTRDGVLPKTISEVNVPPNLKSYQHFKGHQNTFLQVDHEQGEDRILIFSTTHFLHILANSEKVFGDGTFKQSPNLWYQMYTIHGYYKEQLFPLVYCLLPGKTESIYQRMLELIGDKIMEVAQV